MCEAELDGSRVAMKGADPANCTVLVAGVSGALRVPEAPQTGR